MKRAASGCAYAPGFLEALRAVCRTAKPPETQAQADALSHQRWRLRTLEGAQRPEMCDKFMLLDMREPFDTLREECEGDEVTRDEWRSHE